MSQAVPPETFDDDDFDGCSGLMSLYWQWRYGEPPDWEKCGCLPHDSSYEQGGPLVKKFRADVKLMLDVIDSGHPWWGLAMFLAVTIGGLPWIPMPTWKWVEGKVKFMGFNKVRWGFKFKFPRYK